MQHPIRRSGSAGSAEQVWRSGRYRRRQNRAPIRRERADPLRPRLEPALRLLLRDLSCLSPVRRCQSIRRPLPPKSPSGVTGLRLRIRSSRLLRELRLRRLRQDPRRLNASPARPARLLRLPVSRVPQLLAHESGHCLWGSPCFLSALPRCFTTGRVSESPVSTGLSATWSRLRSRV